MFATSVEHAEQIASLFSQAGCSAVAVSGCTSSAQRELIYTGWHTGSIQVVCNCSLLAEGFDFPAIAALVIARPTCSPGFYVQMLGRGMRKATGKEDCLAIDVVGNNSDLSHQMVLPHIVGVSTHEELHALTDSQPSSPRLAKTLFKKIMGNQTQTGLSILDPLGASPYRWTSFHDSYFTVVSRDIVAILEPDRNCSEL